MTPSFHRYSLWVLLPITLAAVGGVRRSAGEAADLTRVSAARLGATAIHLFTEEMGERSAEMVEEAPQVPDREPDSPLLQAARRGDTVAALGMEGDHLVLSVAYATDGASRQPAPPGDEAHPQEPTDREIRGMTLPFQPTALNRFHDRTGLGAALYLRGRRASSVPQEFGPPTVGFGRDQEPPDLMPRSGVLLPLLSPSDAGAQPGSAAPHGFPEATPDSPAVLLVGPTTPDAEAPFSRGGLAYLLFPGVLGMLAWGFRRPWKGGAGASRFGRLRMVGTVLLPLGALWILLLGYGREVLRHAEGIQQRDLVRVLALTGEDDSGARTMALAGAAGVEALLLEGPTLLTSTLPPGRLRDAVAALPPPEPSLPALGYLDSDGESWAFASTAEESGRAIVLMVPTQPEGLSSVFVQLAIIGGFGCLLPLGFLLPLRRVP